MTQPANAANDRVSNTVFPEPPTAADPPDDGIDIAARYAHDIREAENSYNAQMRRGVAFSQHYQKLSEKYRDAADHAFEEAYTHNSKSQEYAASIPRGEASEGWNPSQQWELERRMEVEHRLKYHWMEKGEKFNEWSDQSQLKVEDAQPFIQEKAQLARAYSLLGRNFAVPPPPLIGGAGHQLVYDFAGIDAGVVALRQLATKSQAALEQARKARLELRDSSSGEAAETSQARLLQIEQINKRILAAVAGALQDLRKSADEMRAVDHQVGASLIT